MRSAITICLVPAARQGPFVFHGTGAAGLEAGVRAAAELGFDGVEVFPESAAGVRAADLGRLLTASGMSLAAVGTGAGWVQHKLHLCHPDPVVRGEAREFIGGIIDVAGSFGAPAIIGSMQGRSEDATGRAAALDHLAEALHDLGARAATHGQVLLYEPLNRYETNLFNRQRDAAEFIRVREIRHVALLCDLFHMNVEEADLPAAIGACGSLVGHVHWADSNRWAMGYGHTPAGPVAAALEATGYGGYLSAEVFPLPTPLDAARTTIESIRAFTKG